MTADPTRQTEWIWIADAEASDATALQKSVEPQFQTRKFHRLGEFAEALESAAEKTAEYPAVVLSELEFPDGCFLDFVQNATQRLPAIMIVSRTNTAQTILRSLKLPIQDYFLKPVDGNLLCAKVQRHLESSGAQSTKANLGLQLDRFSMEVKTKSGITISLTVKEFQILSLLHHSYPDGITRTRLIQQIWKGVKVVSRSFDVHLFHLRQKLEPLGFEIEFGQKLKYFLVLKKPQA